MFDVRYHALSLVAVFVALVVGLLLGVAIGDAGLVSGAEKSLRKTLRGDVRQAQRERDDARDQVAMGLRYQRESYPLLVNQRLTDSKVGLLFLGKPSAALAGDVRDALRGSGGTLTGTLALSLPPDLGEIAGAAGATRYRDIDSRPALLGVWPELTVEQAPRERERIATGFAVLLAARTDANLERLVGYTNSAGQSFSTAEEDILLHVAMHAQYHRGKVNALLRASGHEPAPVDFITYVRGAPAAITPR